MRPAEIAPLRDNPTRVEPDHQAGVGGEVAFDQPRDEDVGDRDPGAEDDRPGVERKDRRVEADRAADHDHDQRRQQERRHPHATEATCGVSSATAPKQRMRRAVSRPAAGRGEPRLPFDLSQHRRDRGDREAEVEDDEDQRRRGPALMGAHDAPADPGAAREYDQADVLPRVYGSEHGGKGRIRGARRGRRPALRRPQAAGGAGRAPALAHALAFAAAIDTEPTVVVLGAYAEEIEAAVDLGERPRRPLPGLGARPLRLPPRRPRRAPADADAALVTLGDEPYVSPAAAARLLAARRPGLAALRASYDGRPGHPVLIERELFGRLEDPGDRKPGQILKAAGAEPIPCEDLGTPVDIDTPAQLAELAARAPAQRARPSSTSE